MKLLVLNQNLLKPIKTKRKIDKVKCINGQKAANEKHQKFNTK